jgi:hypothetical protein
VFRRGANRQLCTSMVSCTSHSELNIPGVEMLVLRDCNKRIPTQPYLSISSRKITYVYFKVVVLLGVSRILVPFGFSK